MSNNFKAFNPFSKFINLFHSEILFVKIKKNAKKHSCIIR